MSEVKLSYIKYFQSLRDDERITLFSIQGKVAYEEALKRGYWTGPENPPYMEENQWTLAYDWMRDKMKERIPFFSGDRPMWCWLEIPDSTEEKGENSDCILTIRIPKRRVLLSDFELFHRALNHGIYCKTEKEFDLFTQRYPDHWSTYSEDKLEEYRNEIRKTWDPILDFYTPTDPDEIDWLGNGQIFHTQACVDRFYPHEVIDIKPF